MTTIMAIGAHPDDIEIGIGGTLHKAIRSGHRVVAVDLTDGEETPYGNRELRKEETAKANAALGITERVCLDLPNRVLMDSEEARMKLGTVMREYKPDIVFTHTELDAHPDHVAAFQIVRGAILISRIVKIDLPHQAWRPGPFYSFLCSHLRHNYEPRFVLKLEEEDFAAKLNAVLAYESQFVTGRPDGWARMHITSRANYYGSLARVTYGEPVLTDELFALEDITQVIGHGAANIPKSV